MAELGFVGDGPNSYQVSLSAGTLWEISIFSLESFLV